MEGPCSYTPAWGVDCTDFVGVRPFTDGVPAGITPDGLGMFGGPAPADTPCVFPFTFAGVTYNTCTFRQAMNPWCATDDGSNGQPHAGGEWGDCQLCTLGGSAPSPPAASSEFVTPVVTAIAGAPGGWDTYQLSVTLSASAANVYTIYGNTDAPMSLPAAYQVATPFGADIGGVNPAFFAIANSAALGFAEFDSWLTVGMTDGSNPGALSASPGFGLDAWTDSAAFTTDNGAVFWMSPDDGPSGSAVVAQITITSGSTGVVTMGLQGRSPGGAEDYRTGTIEFAYP
jgi:hypothetical protein